MTATSDARTAVGTTARPARAEEIRDAAARIFHEKGYAATSIQDIADAVGILKGSLYYYIDTKEDLLFEVIKGAHERGLEDLAKWRQLDAPPATRLRAAIEGHVVSNLCNLMSVGVFFHDFRSLSPDRRAEIIRDRDVYDDNLRQLVADGQAAGDFAPEFDPSVVVMGVLGMMNWAYQWYRPDGPLSPADIASAFADQILGGIAIRPDGRSGAALGREGGDDAG